MRGLVFIPGVFLLCAGFAIAQPDVRQATWGMTPEQVRAVEQGHAEEGTSGSTPTLRYVNNEFLPSGTVTYGFASGKLTRVIYTFSAKHEDDLNQFVADFQKIAKAILTKHGEPTCEHVIWLDDSLQNERMPYLIQDRRLPSQVSSSDPEIGLALSLGHYRLFAAWDGPRTQILHTLEGKDGRVQHRVEFYPAGTYQSSDLNRACSE